MPSDEESLRANARARLLRLHAQHRIIHVPVAGAEMKRISLIALLMLPTLAQANSMKTLQCHAAIVHSVGERITGVSERMTGVLVVDSGMEFYALLGSTIYKSPPLKSRKKMKFGVGSDGQTFIKKDAVYSVSSQDTSIIFDECSEVSNDLHHAEK